MTVLLEQNLPVPRAMIEAVSRQMDVAGDPPAGLIAHVTLEDGEGSRIVDIWESQAAYEAFRTSRLEPALQAVAAAQGMDMPPAMSEPTFTEAYDLARGA